MRPVLISATLSVLLAGASGALADCAEELAQLAQDGSAAAPEPADPASKIGAEVDGAATGEGEHEKGGNFATFRQEERGASEGAQATTAEAGDDRAAALQQARAALDAGDEQACLTAVEAAKAM